MAVIGIGAGGSSSASKRSTSFEKLLLHAIAVFFEAFIIATVIARRVQKVETFEDIVSQGVAARCFAQRCTWPGLTGLQSTVQFSQARNKLCLLLLKHLNITFGIYFVLRLLPFAKYAYSIVGFTSTAGASSVAL